MENAKSWSHLVTIWSQNVWDISQKIKNGGAILLAWHVVKVDFFRGKVGGVEIFSLSLQPQGHLDDLGRFSFLLCSMSFHYLSHCHHCPVCGSSRFEESGIRSKRCADCGYELFCNASAAVAAFVLDGQGRLLVCRRACAPAQGTDDLPGGFVDPDETLEQALSRELTEELGVAPASARYLFSIPNRYSWGDILVPTTDCFFLCTLDEHDVPTAGDDVAACRWVPLSEVNAATFGLHSIATAVQRFIENQSLTETVI